MVQVKEKRYFVDARMIKSSTMHGIARYTFNILLQMQTRLLEGEKLFVLVNDDTPLLREVWHKDVSFIFLKSRWLGFGEHFEIPPILKEQRADLFHAPSYVAPFNLPCHLVMTIHDLNHIVLSRLYTPLHKLYYRFFVQRSMLKASCIITVSQFSKMEMLRYFNLDRDKICVTYNGVSDSYRTDIDPQFRAYVRSIYQLPDSYILCLSNNKPHKNISSLVKAYCQSDIEVPLVIASACDRKLIRIADGYKKKHKVFFIRYIDEQHLPAVYANSRIFVYPSAYEGFGLPALEAMACGVPVVVSNTSSLPEVVADCGIYIDPFDIKAMSEALELVMKDEVLRNQIVEKALARSRQFNWSKTAEQTLDVYRKALLTPSESTVKWESVVES